MICTLTKSSITDIQPKLVSFVSADSRFIPEYLAPLATTHYLLVAPVRWIHTPCTSDYSFVDAYSGEAVDRKWENDDLNFDNILNAMLLLFVAATGEGWPDMMHRVFVIGSKGECVMSASMAWCCISMPVPRWSDQSIRSLISVVVDVLFPSPPTLLDAMTVTI